MHAAWLVGIAGDPVCRPCRVCGTKVNPDTGKCKQADTSSCPSQPDLALKVLATAHIADWSGAVENVLIRGEQLAALASVDDEAKLAELIAEKGAQALCFKGPFDVRLASRTCGNHASGCVSDQWRFPDRGRRAHAGFAVPAPSCEALPWQTLRQLGPAYGQEGDPLGKPARGRRCVASGRSISRSLLL